jgi:hypothetical protein
VGRFVMVECAIWTDPDFAALSADAQLLFLWSWTNPKAAISGIYEVSVRAMSRLFGNDSLRVRYALDELARKPMVRYDQENEVLWVVKRAHYANRSPKVAVAMQREVLSCPDTPLLKEFTAMYGSRLAIRVPDGR